MAEPSRFSLAALNLMKQIRDLGYREALERELNNPTLEDPDWCRMIVALLSSGQPVVFEEDPTETQKLYRCHLCNDTGFRMRIDDAGIAWDRHCICPEGNRAAAATERLQHRRAVQRYIQEAKEREAHRKMEAEAAKLRKKEGFLDEQ